MVIDKSSFPQCAINNKQKSQKLSLDMHILALANLFDRDEPIIEEKAHGVFTGRMAIRLATWPFVVSFASLLANTVFHLLHFHCQVLLDFVFVVYTSPCKPFDISFLIVPISTSIQGINLQNLVSHTS
jgi:hypothetical protein